LVEEEIVDDDAGPEVVDGDAAGDVLVEVAIAVCIC
jgi:hypothetical protein